MEILGLQNLSSEVIIFGGLTIISLSLVTLVWRVIVRYGNHTNDVIGKNTSAWVKQTRSNERQSIALNRLADVIDKKLK